MAQLISDEYTIQYSWWRIALVGAALGALHWFTTVLLQSFLLDPLLCGTQFNSEMCQNTLALSGDIATVAVGVIGLFVLIRLRVYRPIVVAIAAAVTSWGIAAWTEGLSWSEIIGWTALLYAISYVLYSWICRHDKTTTVLVIVITVLVIARIVTRL